MIGRSSSLSATVCFNSSPPPNLSFFPRLATGGLPVPPNLLVCTHRPSYLCEWATTLVTAPRPEPDSSLSLRRHGLDCSSPIGQPCPLSSRRNGITGLFPLFLFSLTHFLCFVTGFFRALCIGQRLRSLGGFAAFLPIGPLGSATSKDVQRSCPSPRQCTHWEGLGSPQVCVSWAGNPFVPFFCLAFSFLNGILSPYLLSSRGIRRLLSPGTDPPTPVLSRAR